MSSVPSVSSVSPVSFARPRLAGALAALLLATAGGACRDSGDDDTTTDIDVDDTDDNTGGDVSIVELQDPAGTVGINDPVTLRGVVVLAKDNYGGKKGNIFVGEPGGGAYSGVLVYGIETADFDAVAVGDLVDLEGGVKTEFALTDDTSGRTTTELQAAEGGTLTLTKVGTGAVPAPELVDAAALAAMDPADADAEWEKWEGVLIEVQDITITGGIRNIDVDDPTFIEFNTEGDLHIDASLAAIPDPVNVGECVHSVIGMGDYFFNWKVLPRSLGEVDISGTACAGIPTATVEEVQTQVVTGPVTLENVIVTAKSFNKKTIWVQDLEQSGPNQGVLVFAGVAVPAEIEVGAIVNVAGDADEYTGSPAGSLTAGDGGITEIFSPSITFVSAPTFSPIPVTSDIATLVDTVDGEPYEGVLVTLENVKVTDKIDDGGFITFELTQNGSVLLAHDSIYRHTAGAIGDCYAKITGIFSTNTFDDVLSFLPTSESGIATGGVCP